MKKITVLTNDDTAVQVIALLADQAVSLSMEDVPEPESAPRRRRVVRKPYRPGTTAYHTLASEFSIGDRLHYKDAGRRLANHGYAPSSVNSTLSRLVRHGFFESLGGGYFRKLKDVPKPYSFQASQTTLLEHDDPRLVHHTGE